MRTEVHGVHDEAPASQRSTAALVHDLIDQLTRLVRTEIRLAQKELSDKGKEAGKGVVAFSAAGVLALYGGAALVATAVLLLTLVVQAWLAALAVGIVLLLLAGVSALIGRARLRQSAPLLPESTLEESKRDVQTVKEAVRHGTST